MSPYVIRPMIEADIPRLAEIGPGFVSDTALAVERLGSGIEAGWQLVERPLPTPFDKGHLYDFDRNEQENIRRRFQRGDGLHLVVENEGRLVGLLDVTPEDWNNTAWVWNLMLDQAVRRQGIGRALFRHAVDWGRRMGYRALIFETQTNNVAACKFYVALGCQLEGLRETLYTNEDIERGEVGVFWSFRLV